MAHYLERRKQSFKHKFLSRASWILHIPAALLLTTPQLLYILSQNIEKDSFVALFGNIALVSCASSLVNTVLMPRASMLMIRINLHGLDADFARLNQLRAESQYLLLVLLNNQVQNADTIAIGLF